MSKPTRKGTKHRAASTESTNAKSKKKHDRRGQRVRQAHALLGKKLEGSYRDGSNSNPIDWNRWDYLDRMKYKAEHGPAMIEWVKEGGTMPGFAVSIGVSKWSLAEWARKYPAFREARKLCLSIEEDRLLSLMGTGMKGRNGLGSWQSAGIFLLKAKHAYRDDGVPEEDDEESDRY